MDTTRLRSEIVAYLHEQGISGSSEVDNKDIGVALAEAVIDNCLTFQPPEQMSQSNVAAVDTIIGFAFGTRFV